MLELDLKKKISVEICNFFICFFKLKDLNFAKPSIEKRICVLTSPAFRKFCETCDYQGPPGILGKGRALFRNLSLLALIIHERLHVLA